MLMQKQAAHASKTVFSTVSLQSRPPR